MSPTTVILLVILASVVASLGIAAVLVRIGRRRAEANIASLGPIERSMAASSLGLTSPGPAQVRSTGTLVLTADEVAFAQWRPERFVRIPRADLVAVDTTREHLGRTLKGDVLRLRWRQPGAADGEQSIALFVRDLDDWVHALGGAPGAPAD
jgi:hypothetical protein